MKTIQRKKTGFTLIELLVVATIIIILSAIGLVSFANAGKGARNAKRKSDLETVRQALVLYKSDTGSYPSGTYSAIMTTLSTGANKYISSPTPLDPKDGVTNCGVSGTTVCRYTYALLGQTFTLTAPLEGLANFTLTNP